MKKLIKFCVFFLALFSTVSFAANTASAAKDNGIIFTDSQRPIIVQKAQPYFAIVVQANPTTGFSWLLKSYDQKLIKPISRVYVATTPTKKYGFVGGGGYEKWTFAVKSLAFVVPQTTSITLIYSRPWDLEGAQATNFKVVMLNDH